MSESCWRCEDVEVTMTHIWRGCLRVQPFWTKVTGVKFKNDPTSLLLFMIPNPTYMLKRNLITFLLKAVKTIIFRLWRSPQISTVTDRFKEIFSLQLMEELRAEAAKLTTMPFQARGEVHLLLHPVLLSFTPLILPPTLVIYLPIPH